jgi:glycine cleavage system protein P-like pyridoxal-binding family
VALTEFQASAQMAGMKVVPVGTAHDGSVNMDDLKKKVSSGQL